MKRVTEEGFKQAAILLKSDVATVKAVYEVESNGNGFIDSGEPKILFEGHKFWEMLKKRGIDPNSFYNAANKDILYPKWTREFYAKGKDDNERGKKEHIRLQRAEAINREAALQSASWGAFQIMGFNYELAGFKKLQDFINAMYRSEDEHLKAFINFCINRKIDGYLRNKEWAKFARAYNGAEYAKNNYDTKLLKAYKKYAV